MTRVTIRELQQHTRRVLDRVEHGEPVEITRRGLPIARLVTIRAADGPEPWPEIEARLERTFGKRPRNVGAARQLLADRG